MRVEPGRERRETAEEVDGSPKPTKHAFASLRTVRAGQLERAGTGRNAKFTRLAGWRRSVTQRSLPVWFRVVYARFSMNVTLLIGAIVRQTMVLIAELATAGGVRAPLAHVADKVFMDLVRELERQGVSRKVSADMFGMG